MTNSSSAEKFRAHSVEPFQREEMKSRSTGFLGSEEQSRSNSREKSQIKKRHPNDQQIPVLRTSLTAYGKKSKQRSSNQRSPKSTRPTQDENISIGAYDSEIGKQQLAHMHQHSTE